MWVVVEAKSKDEFLAEAEIKALGIKTFLPQYTHLIRHARTKKLVKRSLFPGYLFAEFDLDHPNWTRIFTRRGVMGMIMAGSLPRTVPDKQMDMVRKEAKKHEGIVLESCPLTKDQVVMIVAGQFNGFKATVKQDPKGNSVSLETMFFGQPTTVILSRDQVAPVQTQ